MPAKSQKSPSQPTEAQLKSAYNTWKQGGLSIWQVKKQSGISARLLLPAFEKLSGKKIKSPAVRLPGKERKAAKSGTATKEEPQSARRAA